MESYEHDQEMRVEILRLSQPRMQISPKPVLKKRQQHKSPKPLHLSSSKKRMPRAIESGEVPINTTDLSLVDRNNKSSNKKRKTQQDFLDLLVKGQSVADRLNN